jgi:hypothetical protein
MSSGLSFSYSAVTVAILGVALLIAGVTFAYLSFTVEWLAAQRLFTPLGVVLAITGALILISLASRE